MKPTKALSQESDDFIMEQEKAPFRGILVPESHYREYMKDREELPICEKSLKDATGQVNLPQMGIWPALIVGAGLGFIAASLAH